MKEQEKTSHLKKGYSIRWMFNSSMIWSAILGWIISAAVENILVGGHQGEERIGLWFFLIIGLMLWIATASDAKKDEALKTATEDYLFATSKANAAYRMAFYKVMGDAAYHAVHTEAMKDPAYQEAKDIETAKDTVHSRAFHAVHLPR